MMLRILLPILTGLVGAALLHLTIILALPGFSERDAYSKVVGQGQPFQFHALGSRPDPDSLSKDDPFLDVAVCAFDLTEAPVRLSGGSGVPFWSLATFDAASNETFSINDRTSSGGGLDVIVATPVQAVALRKAMPASLMQPIIVEAREAQGYAVLRAAAPRKSFRKMASEFLAEADCSPVTWQ